MSEKWKVAEIENLPKLKGGGGTEIISRNVWGYPPLKLRDREGVYINSYDGMDGYDTMVNIRKYQGSSPFHTIFFNSYVQ